MVGHMNLLSMVVPETLQFLNGGWFLVHIVAICVVGFIGYKVGQAKKS
jgi:hypothetical protein